MILPVRGTTATASDDAGIHEIGT